VSLFNGPFNGPFLINLVECCSSNAAALWSSAWWLEADPVEKNQKAQEPHSSSSSSRASFLPAAGLGLPKELPLKVSAWTCATPPLAAAAQLNPTPNGQIRGLVLKTASYELVPAS
jgi:hypothetical protein